MKKFLCSVLVILSIFSLTGCNQIKSFINKDSTIDSKDGSSTTPDSSSSDSQNQSNLTIKDYYPFKENVKYEYIGKGNEYSSFWTAVDYIKDDKIQVRKNNGGTELVNVLQYKDNELKLIYSKEDCYYREDFTGKASNRDEVLLKEPLVKGTSWTLSDGRKRYISKVDVPIQTLTGNYKALEVTTEGTNGEKTFDYYAVNTGLVETIYNASQTDIKSTLNKISDNSPLTQNVKFYYPNSENGKVYFIEKPITFNTNDITKLSFEKFFKAPPNSSLEKLLGPDIKIKSLYLNENMVYVDFSKDFVKEMNAGSHTESLILEAITDTLGAYYNVSKVYITIEGEPYISGHILMKKGEAFIVNTINAEKLTQ